MTGHHFFRKLEDVGLDPEQIPQRIVVLKTVEPTEPWLFLLGFRNRLPHEILEQKNRSVPLLVRKLLLVLRGHVSKIDHLDQFLDQFRLGQKIGFGWDSLEVDLSLGFFATVTLHAILLEQRLEKRIELVG